MSELPVKGVVQMMLARLVSMVVGLAGIPILMTFLGIKGFAAWAVLFGGSMAFYILEFGMSSTTVRLLADIRKADDPNHAGTVIAHVILILSAVYVFAGIILFLVADDLALLLGLPTTQLLSPGSLIEFVYCAVFAITIFKTGTNRLHAAGRFSQVARTLLLQSLLSSLVAWSAAGLWNRLDLVIIGYWSTLVLIQFAAWGYARREMPWRILPGKISLSTIKEMLGHGFNLQFTELVYFIHFQFDKMIIAGFSTLFEVAHYEVASRSVQALRSLPASGISALLPTVAERLGSDERVWELYQAMTLAIAFLIVMFLLLPLAVAPIFLFAWVGQVGYHAQWVFMFLATGIAVNIFAMPIALFFQSIERTDLIARFALLSIVLNVLFSLVFIQFWNKEGAAAGTGLAMMISGVACLCHFHRMHGKRLQETLAIVMRRLSLPLIICIGCMLIEHYIEPMVISSRWYMGPASVALYLFGACAIILSLIFFGRMSDGERELIRRFPLVGRWVITTRSTTDNPPAA